MKDIINLSVVNFNALWGEKEKNLKRIIEFAEEAGMRGADMIVFPETALSGYDDDESHSERTEKMHCILAETIPGPATEQVAKAELGIYKQV